MVPSFAEYEEVCNVYEMNTQYAFRSAELLRKDHGVLFLGHPNNPDGRYFDTDDLLAYAEHFPNTLLIVDESYIDFAPFLSSCVSGVPDRPNLVVVRSLTKVFALPGLRLGYVVAHPSVIRQLVKRVHSWNLNSLAYEAGLYLFARYDKLLPDISALLEESQCLQQDINRLEGYETLSSPMHYFLLRLKGARFAPQMKTFLAREHGLLVRDASTFRGLNRRYLRISTQTPDKNQLLLQALAQWTEH